MKKGRESPEWWVAQVVCLVILLMLWNETGHYWLSFAATYALLILADIREYVKKGVDQ